MKKSIFQEKNLKEPEEIFNIIGNEKFEEEWSDLPLNFFKNKSALIDLSKDKVVRIKHMANKVFKKFCKFLKDDDVSIYTTKKFWDEVEGDVNIVQYDRIDFEVTQTDFLLVDLDKNKNGEFIRQGRRQFWIEMPKDKNPMAFKKPGSKIIYDKDYMKSIFPDVAKTIKGKITHENYADYLKKFLSERNEKAPKRVWVGENLSDEIKKENIRRGQA